MTGYSDVPSLLRSAAGVLLSTLGAALFSLAATAHENRVAESAATQARRLATAAGQANSVSDLQVLIEANCSLQPWQVLLQTRGSSGVSVQQSPTVAAWKRDCVRSMIGYSKFHLVDRD